MNKKKLWKKLLAGLSYNDTTAANRINVDYSQTLSYQYTHEHNAIISDGAKGFGYNPYTGIWFKRSGCW